MAKHIFTALLVLAAVSTKAQQIYLRPSAGYGWQYTRLKNTHDFIEPYRKGQIDMGLWLEYRNKKNIGYMVGVGEGWSWSGFNVAEKITGSKDRGIYVNGWAPPFTRLYAGVEFPVTYLLNKEKYLQSLEDTRKKSQFFIGGGLAMNFYTGGPRDDFHTKGYIVYGKDNFFKNEGRKELPVNDPALSTWLRLRYQHYNKKGKETWSLLAMAHYAPFQPLYKDEIHFETKEGRHVATNVNRALHFVVSFSYPIRLWHKKPKTLNTFDTEQPAP